MAPLHLHRRLCLGKKVLADRKTLYYRVADYSAAADPALVSIMPKPNAFRPPSSTPQPTPASPHWRRAAVRSR
jgi:hypothetical protein